MDLPDPEDLSVKITITLRGEEAYIFLSTAEALSMTVGQLGKHIVNQWVMRLTR